MNVAAILKVKGRSVATAPPEDTVETVAQKLASRKIGAIVIVGDGGHVNGIISERDIIRVVAKKGCDGTPRAGKRGDDEERDDVQLFQHDRSDDVDHDTGAVPPCSRH